MKKILALAVLLPLSLAAQNHEQACGVFLKVNNLLQKEHYKPKPVDDSLSVFVFNKVMEQLDDNNTLFLQQEYDQLAIHKYKIDDYLKAGDCSFFTDFITAYKSVLERNKGYIEEIAASNLALDTKDTLFYSKKAFPYQVKPEKIKNFTRKKIVHNILEDIAKLSKNKDSLKANFAELSKISREKVLSTYICRINSYLSPNEGFEDSIYNLFFSSFCSYFDPHTTYFNYNEKASFLSTLASENYSLGIYVSQNENEEIIVEEIVPGGPAYKTQIDKGDKIVKLAAENREYPVSCASIETITNIVFSDTYKKVELTLRKNDGTVYSVNLEKKIMKAEDNSVYSFVIGKENPMGYIKIPSFYTALDNNSIKGCADDVAKEILKLKEEHINGLIIDLQYNGGGSMDEVIRLAGMFVDFGPLSVVVDRDNSKHVIKDYNRGNLYDGPMVVLVNGFSASASEFFAGVMQDYHRAVIAGNRTLGKATMQTIIPLDESNPQDFVKVTIDKFYRVTGNSSQFKGIIPDIQMPSYLDTYLPREDSMPTALKNDSISIALKFKPLPGSFKQIAAQSLERIKNNRDFNMVTDINKQIDVLYTENKAPLALNFDTVFNDVHAMDQIWKDINDAEEKEQNIHISTPRDTYQRLMYDDFLANTNEYRVKLAKSSPYIKESINILTDLNAVKAQGN